MTDFYTNVQVYGNRILYRGVENGRSVSRKVEYFPTLFVDNKKSDQSIFHTVHGKPVEEFKPGDIRSSKEFIQKYKDVENFNIYGNHKFEYSFIFDKFKGDVHWDISALRIANIDIEVESDDGFPEPEEANKKITAITMKFSDDKYHCFGCDNFTSDRPDVVYYRCSTETELLTKFLSIWSARHPDIITGWNIKLFDVPYLVNRILKVLGEEYVKKLSPWGIIHEKKITIGFRSNRVLQTYKIWGISIIDYMDAYMKFAPEGKSQDSYRLDNICHVELDERKLSYDEYGNLFNLYKENYQLFMEYNIRDTELVEKLEAKLKLIELILTLAYDSKTNFDDVFMQTRMWDQIIHCHLLENNIVLPPSKENTKDRSFDGAYVKEPQIGMHEYIASFDLTSLYPSLILQYNISPETIVPVSEYTSEMHDIASSVSVESIMNKGLNTEYLKKANLSVTPNGQFFRIDKEGFMPIITRKMFEDRQRYKKEMISAQKVLEKEKDEQKRKEIEKTIAKFKNLQMAKKVCLNSLYGSCGTPYFRFYDLRIALAITLSGQLSIKWIEREINKYMNKLLKTENEDYVIASDTDSIYLCLAKLVGQTIKKENPNSTDREIIQFLDRSCQNIIQPFIDSSYSKLAILVNAYSQKMNMKRESLCNKGIWTAKKRYILNVFNQEGVEYETPEIKIMGLEVKKSSTPSFFREKMEKCIEIVINEDQKTLISYIDNVRSEMKTTDLASISFPTGINGLSKYTDKTTELMKDSTPIHVRGAILYNYFLKKHKLEKKYERIKEGEKIKWIYLKTPNPILNNNVLSFSQVIPEEFDLKEYIDYDTQFDKAFIEPFKIITDKIGWKCEETSSILDFYA